jgi:sodium transport system permease protein
VRPSMIGRVAGKEILSTLRDQRAIISTLVIPLVILPVIMLGLPLLLGGLFQREQTTVTTVGVHGEANLPPALKALLEKQNVSLTAVADPEAAVRDGTVAVAIGVPSGFAAKVTSGQGGDLTLYSKKGNMKSELNAGKVQQAVGDYARQLVSARLEAAGLDPSLLEPVHVQSVDASSAAEKSSGQLSWLIPFFIAIWTLTGGQMTAIDATAGEKERGTLEALLVSPIRRSEVVIGKFLATLTFGLSAAVMAIVGYVVGGAILSSVFEPKLGAQASSMVQVMGGSLDISLPSVLLLLVSALLLAGTVAALLLGITLFARSFKEAQSYVAPLSFLLILPAVGLQFKDLLGFGNGIYLIPIFNALVLMDDIVKGTAAAAHVLATWLTLLVVIVLLLLFAYRNFRREGVIFRV